MAEKGRDGGNWVEITSSSPLHQLQNYYQYKLIRGNKNDSYEAHL